MDTKDLGRWQPIETAPKDGTVILGFDGGMPTDHRRERANLLFWDDEEWCPLWNGFEPWNPTHWMPLPEPPQSEMAGA